MAVQPENRVSLCEEIILQRRVAARSMIIEAAGRQQTAARRRTQSKMKRGEHMEL